MAEYYGHRTFADGSHEALTKDEAEAIWKRVEELRAKREAAMPTAEDTGCPYRSRPMPNDLDSAKAEFNTALPDWWCVVEESETEYSVTLGSNADADDTRPYVSNAPRALERPK